MNIDTVRLARLKCRKIEKWHMFKRKSFFTFFFWNRKIYNSKSVTYENKQKEKEKKVVVWATSHAVILGFGTLV